MVRFRAEAVTFEAAPSHDLPVCWKEEDMAEPTYMRLGVGTTVGEAERLLILKTLRATQNNKTHAAKILGISLKTLHNKLNEYRKGSDMAEPTYEELKAKLAELEKQVQGRKRGAVDFKVSEKGGVSVYGLGRFPVTLYYEQWIRLLDQADQLREFLEVNKSSLRLKNPEA